MNKNIFPITAQIIKIFELPINTVWEGLTNPTIVKKYFFGTNLKSNFTVGSEISFEGYYNSQKYVDKGRIQEIIAPNKLIYTYRSSWSNLPDIEENYQLVTYRLVEKGKQTELTITQTNIDEKSKIDSENSWINILNQMEKVLLGII